jgi:uncharacterized protein YbjQ (UPF0145 family)
MASQCKECGNVFPTKPAMCLICGSIEIDEAPGEQLEKQEMEAAELQKYIELAQNIVCHTVESPPDLEITESIGLVFGNSSKQAFWGLSTQANRLSRAYEAALANLRFDAAAMGANAVVGVRFALNNSTGSAAAVLTGSSEAVMLLGTAVVTN